MPFANLLANHWPLDPGFDFLNHGSFGACPRPVLAEQQRLRDRLEAQPLRFLVREYEPLLDSARETVATFVGAEPVGFTFMPNVTTAVATVLHNLRLEPGDEIVTTTHVYGAVRSALARYAARTGVVVVEAPLPFPLAEPSQVTAAVLAACSPRTRFAVLDHITSPTALRFPIESLVPLLRERGIETLIDGAHGPGQIPIDIRAMGAGYYAGNGHKWLSGPKGAAFLAVRPDLVEGFEPLVPSHGASSKRSDRSRFHLEFDWLGTDDPTAYLALPAAIQFLGSLHPGGWPALYAANHALAIEAQGLLAAAIGIERPVPAAMIGAMAALPLPPEPGCPPTEPPFHSPTQEALYAQGFEVPVFPFPAWPRRLIRVTAHAYNDADQYRRLAAALKLNIGLK